MKQKSINTINDGKISINFIGLNEVKKNKKLTVRVKDITNLEALGNE